MSRPYRQRLRAHGQLLGTFLVTDNTGVELPESLSSLTAFRRPGDHPVRGSPVYNNPLSGPEELAEEMVRMVVRVRRHQGKRR